MLIGIDASRANRRHKSGTEWYSYYLIRALAEIDKKNKYILYTDTPLCEGLSDLTTNADNKTFITSVRANGMQPVRSPHNNIKAKVLRWPWRFFWTQGRLSLEMLFNRPDILFVPAHALPLIHPKKSVVTIHDIGFRNNATLYEHNRIGADSRRRRGFVNFCIRFLTAGKYGATSFDYLEWSTQFALKQAASIITISQFTKSELLSAYHPKPEKISVVYNGYNKDLYHPIPDDALSGEVLERYGITRPYFFYVGRLEKKKNIATLIEAFSILKSEQGEDFKHKLCLVGDASFGFDEIKYTIHEYSLSNDVIVTGWVAEEDLPHIFARAEAFIFPSNYEGFGIPLLQAMATQTPITASNIASIPEIVEDAAILFDPKSSQDMSKALSRVLFDQTLREQLVEHGSKRVSHFSWKKAAEETLEVFNRLKNT